MANKKNWLKIFIVVLIFGMTFVIFDACSKNTDQRLNGTWVHTRSGQEIRYIYKSGKYEITSDGIPVEKGTFTTSDGKIFYHITHRWGSRIGLDSKWYSNNEWEAALKLKNINPPSNNGSTFEYTVNGNTLTWGHSSGSKIVFTKESSSVKNFESSSKSSGSVSAIIGRWSLTEGPRRNNPEEMELLKDGAGICDGLGITWKIENGRFYLIHPSAAFSSIYNVSGSSLTLTKEDGEVLKYKKK